VDACLSIDGTGVERQRLHVENTLARRVIGPSYVRRLPSDVCPAICRCIVPIGLSLYCCIRCSHGWDQAAWNHDDEDGSCADWRVVSDLSLYCCIRCSHGWDQATWSHDYADGSCADPRVLSDLSLYCCLRVIECFVCFVGFGFPKLGLCAMACGPIALDPRVSRPARGREEETRSPSTSALLLV
jgi:hypothetical protein